MSRLLWNGPDDARGTLLLAQGAGAPMDSPAMSAIAAALAGAGLRIARFEFAYMAARRDGIRKPPPRADRLLPEYRDAVANLKHSGPIVVGGKSMGAGWRACSQANSTRPDASRGCFASATRSIRQRGRTVFASPTLRSCGRRPSSCTGPAMRSARGRKCRATRSPTRSRSSGSTMAITI